MDTKKNSMWKIFIYFFFTKTSFLSVRLQSIKTRAYNLYLTKGLKIKTRKLVEMEINELSLAKIYTVQKFHSEKTFHCHVDNLFKTSFLSV